MVKLKDIKKSFKKEHLESPLIRHFYYPLTLAICYLCINLGISANMINAIGVVANIAAALVIFFSNSWIAYLTAGLLIIFGYTTDFCDGTIARYCKLKGEEEKVNVIYGKWSDEVAGLIGVGFIFSAGILKSMQDKADLWFLFWGLSALFGFMMMNFAAILSELIRRRFEIENEADSIRKKIGRRLFGINPRIISFSFEIQWTLIILGVIFNQFYALFVIFAIISNLQWLARYYIYSGK